MSYIISVIGAGGKTTLIHQLADHYRRDGKSVLITTTTHMLVEPDTDLSCDLSVLLRKITEQGLLMAGSPCLKEPAKMAGLPREIFVRLQAVCDIILVEADGARHFSVKFPSANEPVIPPESDEIILVQGTFDLGKRAEDAVFRQNLLSKQFGLSSDARISFRLLAGIADYYQSLVPERLLRQFYSYRISSGNNSNSLQYLEIASSDFQNIQIRKEQTRNMKLTNTIPGFTFDPRRFVICRGGGDLATGIVHRLSCSGFHVLILETTLPAAIRRQVSFCEAVYDGQATVEGKTAKRIESYEEILPALAQGMIPLLTDPEGNAIHDLEPEVVVDAIIAKKNLGTTKDMAPCVIGVGPGFTAGQDCHAVIETTRGHNLARVIREGSARPNTGIPGDIGGYTSERVIHSVFSGTVKNVHQIGDIVERGDIIAKIVKGPGIELPVVATIPGIIRGLIRDGYQVPKGFKIADIDPRRDQLKNCFTISDKSRSIGGSVLEVVTGHYFN